jgi:hypothetical protein
VHADEALVAFTQDLVAEAAAGLAVELAGGFGGPPVPADPNAPQVAAQASPWPPKVGAAAVHPQLGGHLIAPFPGDTISGHAHAHVPRPVEPMLPDPREEKLAGQKQQLDEYGEWEQQVRDYDRASRELEGHAKKMRSQGKRLPPYKATGKKAAIKSPSRAGKKPKR